MENYRSGSTNAKEDGGISKTSSSGGRESITSPNEEFYEGQTDGKIRHGRGVYRFGCGSVYEGQYFNNRRSGEGHMSYSLSEKYSNKTAVTKSSYLGGYLNGYRENCGVFQYSNGDTYSGEWRKGYKHGSGIYNFYSDKSKLIGIWKYGMIVQGKWILTNGLFYDGIFKNNKPITSGVWVLPNGNQQTIEYYHMETAATEEKSDYSSIGKTREVSTSSDVHYIMKECAVVHEE